MNFYMILGLRPGATDGEIRRAYRRLARRHHPGINPGDQTAAERFRQIVRAYEVLIDPELRRKYDAGEVPVAVAPEPHEAAPTFQFEGFDFSAMAEGHAASTFGDLFADVIRAAVPGTAPARGADLHGELHLSFEAAMQGTTARLTVTRLNRCVVCQGRGRVETMEAAPCPQCGGVGTVRGARGHMLFTKSCGHCAGTGVLHTIVCQACRGEGVVMHTEVLSIDVPAGVSDGETLRLPARGSAGRHGAPPGDLYVTIHVAPHRFFRREGNDIHIEVPIALHEAMLGARIDVPGPGGPCKVKIPPGTQSGQQFRVHERGVPSPRQGPAGQGQHGPGDLVVTIKLVLPALQDERSKALIRELAQLNPQDVRQDLGV
jgi:molecular chaperone DnaJ